MSVGVTEPKSEPVGPAFTSNRSTAFESASAISLRLVRRLRLVARAQGVALLQLRHPRRRRLLGELAGEEVVAGVAARDRDDVAAQADVIDVLRGG